MLIADSPTLKVRVSNLELVWRMSVSFLLVELDAMGHSTCWPVVIELTVTRVLTNSGKNCSLLIFMAKSFVIIIRRKLTFLHDVF